MSILNYKFLNNAGHEEDMQKFAGKNILIVNTASYCGFTNQYEGLQELYLKNSDKLEIIAFPCNQFGNQEPGTNIQIKNFCKTFNVTFTLAAKIDVNGEKEHPIYKYLKEKSGKNSDIKWNFEKFLVKPDGSVTRHGSKFLPYKFDAIINGEE